MCHAFAREEARIMVADLNFEAAARVTPALTAKGSAAFATRMDVACESRYHTKEVGCVRAAAACRRPSQRFRAARKFPVRMSASLTRSLHPDTPYHTFIEHRRDDRRRRAHLRSHCADYDGSSTF